MSIGVLKSICVDFSNESLYQYITAFSEEIYSRTIEITPLNNGDEYVIPIGTTARLEARKPDNKPILHEAKIDFTNSNSEKPRYCTRAGSKYLSLPASKSPGLFTS